MTPAEAEEDWSRDSLSETRGGGKSRQLVDVRAFYRTGHPIVVRTMPPGVSRVVASRATGATVEAELSDAARFENLAPGTYAIEVLSAGGDVLAEELTTVGKHQGERPVHGFATSFQDADTPVVLGWHRALRSTVVQVYDWMASYTEPLGPATGWQDPSQRPVSFDALHALSDGLRELGAVSHAYAPIYAVGNDFATAHPEMLLYQPGGEAIRFLDQIVLADPGNTQWQRHFVTAYGAAADVIGFEGFHIDSYGYPRIAHDHQGNAVDLAAAYQSFLRFVREARPADMLSFNQVNGVPSAARLPSEPSFRYCEVWPPNTMWRHFEGLLDRSSGRAGHLGTESCDALVRGSIACYPPVWGGDQPIGPLDKAKRADALRTVVSTEAIATCLGASALLYGDRTGVLCDPYYPKHSCLSSAEAVTVLAWRRFALRCRDLFLEGEDTSWYEINDENGAVSADATAPVLPEPVGGALFARVVHADGRLTVGVVDLTGSPSGLWSEPTSKGSTSSVRLRVLLDHPDRWQVHMAVLGATNERFVAAHAKQVAHRQGRALEVDLPLVDGWSVLRITRS